MRPGTLHFVYTAKNSFCRGSHFYTTGTVVQSAAALVDTFVLDRFLTNTAHFPTRSLLRRMLLFYFKGLFDPRIDIEGFRLPIAYFSCTNYGQLNR